MTTTIIKKILNLLIKNELTSIEIADKLKIKKEYCSVYINTLYKDGRVKRVNISIPFKYKASTTNKKFLQEEILRKDKLLRRLYNGMDNYMVFNNEKIEEEEKSIEIENNIKEIEEEIA